MTRMPHWAMLLPLCLAGCGGLNGAWIGSVTCDALTFQMEMQLDRESGAWRGTGEQSRAFTNTRGKQTEHVIDFDAFFEQLDGNLRMELSCTGEVVVVDGDIETDGCTPLLFRDWDVDWDGGDLMTLSSPDGCDGELIRR